MKSYKFSKSSGLSLEMQPFPEYLLKLWQSWINLLGAKLLGLGHSLQPTLHSQLLPHQVKRSFGFLWCEGCWVFLVVLFSFVLLISPWCFHFSHFCWADIQLFDKPWGNLPIQIRQVQILLLKVLSWGSASVKPGPIKPASGYGFTSIG